MNQNQIQQLTSHLSQALDQNYDVVNMDAVLSVICALEGTTITKEQLEATRLAKYINQLRRRTKNEHLARRAKSLLKKWREMVGIQQNVTESHQLSTVNVSLTPMQQLSSMNASLPMQQQPSSDFLKTDPDMTIYLPLSPSQQIIHQDTQHSSDAMHSQMNHTSFPNFVNNAQKESKNILRRHEATPIMVEQTVANHENEAAVVIDIASDSDENDLNNSLVSSKRGSLQNPTIVSASLAIPIPIPSPSPKQKKLKKNKKTKDKDVQNIRGVNSKVADALSQADSEIFSLSNSSMSSIFSGDATTTLGTSQHNKQRLHASELTFSGRFKSVSGQNNNTAGFLTVRSTESSKKQSGKYDDYNIYDSSGASCSRLSPLNIEDGSRKMETKQVDARMQHLTAVLVGSNDMENTTSQSRSHLPKKRGRKRGSKGVDSLIAKESSTSLSQQIFFGQGSTVKKVKTTKELFNEIQSRKLSVSTTSNLSNSSTTNRAEQATMHAAILPRPTSSCSDTSIHSPQILETYSANVTLMGVDTFSNKLDTANTDSDTVTSEPSRDSTKSQDIKGTSLDNSNSNSFGIFAKSNMNKKKENLNDITTQLMHLIHSLKSPLSVYEIEEMYLAEMVPCSCLVVEEEDNNALKGEPENLVSDNNVRNDPKINFNNDTMEHKKDKDILLSIERLDNDNEIVENQAKPVRSIFDLDFDDDINSITYEIIKPTVNMEERKNSLEARNVSNNVAQLDNNYSQTLETENNETIAPNLPMNPAFSVYEDPDCIAKQRFYVQTNKVTNFHINALHNYCIPNINGNWDDSVNTSSTLLSLKNNLLHPLESSYTVTNGADVVPKYGFISSDRIKKDLSSVKFVKPFKAKPFKSLIAPFLGVAKYLPTCRRAKRRLNIASNRLSTQLPEKIIDMGSNYNVPTEMPPLKVNIDVTDSSHNENPVPINILHTTSFDAKSCSSVQDFRKSNNLLKLVNDDELQLGAEKIMIKKKLVQNYWNGKNLNIKTTNNSSSSGSDSEDKTENANENDYENNEEYAIVQRPTSTSHDHIVLTIKKTPSKINSPANSMITTKASPIVTLNSERNNVKKKVVPDNTVLDPLAKCQLMRLPFRPRHHHYRYHRTSRRKRNFSLTSQKVDLELKHIFNLKETVASDIALHEKLFFQHELCGENALGIKERIINYSSSSSNYDDESEIEVTSLEGEDGDVEVEAKNQPTSFDNTRSHNQYNLQIETDTTEDKFDSDDSLLLSSSDEDIDGDDAFNEPFFDEANNDMENNNLLKSFNSIYTNSLTNDYLNGSSNKYCNNNHLAFTNLTRNSIETSAETSTMKKLPLIGVEYRTGYRSSPEVNGTTTSIAGYQEFKEWHQVLQLKSYNNEPLIVLPYVVLE